MGAFTGVSQYFNKPLDIIALEFGYDEDNICILRGDLTSLKNKHFQTYNNIINCQYHADRRSPIIYAQDIIASWLFEDHFLNFLSTDSFSLSLNGADSKRKILPGVKTSTVSDYLLTTPDIQIKMELMNDYTGFWARNHVLHLRDNKYKQLQNSGSLFIAISTPTGEFAIFDFRQPIPARYISSHVPYGNKPAYELIINPDIMKPIEKKTIIHAINALIT